jgi:hypothetical protein
MLKFLLVPGGGGQGEEGGHGDHCSGNYVMYLESPTELVLDSPFDERGATLSSCFSFVVVGVRAIFLG